MLVLLLGACLIDSATYERRLEELTDHDGDGVVLEADCDDGDAAVHPGAEERCNGVDDNCDGTVDEEPTDGRLWYSDADRDGYGHAEVVVVACEPPPGTSSVGTDCDDANAARYPGATEVPYDGVDQDCTGADLTDADLDGYAAVAAGGDDCNDDDPEVHPGAVEAWANGFTDNDCDPENEGGVEEYGPTWLGRTDGGQLGYRMGPLADLDGDGREEFWAAPLFDATFGTYAGSVHVLNLESAADLSGAASLSPDLERTFLGVAGGVGPDAGGDGVLDLVFAGDGRDGGRGAVWILDGSSLLAGEARDIASVARMWVYGENASNYLGHDLAVLSDFSGDGSALLAVTIPSAPGSAGTEVGAMRFFEWDAEGPTALADAVGGADGYYQGGQFGTGVRSVPDVDGDGLADYLVQLGAGDIAMVLPGGAPSPRIPEDAIVRITGTGAGEVASCEVVGDVDGDDEPDLACGAQGGAWLFTNLDAFAVRTPDDAATIFDAGAATVRATVDLGDLDSDGLSETFFTAADSSGTENHAFVVTGDSAGGATTVRLADLPLQAAGRDVAARCGFQAFLLPKNAVHERTLLLGCPSDDSDGADRGAVSTLSLPQAPAPS